MPCTVVGGTFEESDRLSQMESRLKALDNQIAEEVFQMIKQAEKKAQRAPLIPPMEKLPKPLRRFMGVCLMPLFVPLLLTVPIWILPYWILTGNDVEEAFSPLYTLIFTKIMPPSNPSTCGSYY